MTEGANRQTLAIVHLYPEQMNVYGDRGNVLALVRRAAWHGYETEVVAYHPGAPFPRNVDAVIGGGGQDSGQITVHGDLLRVGDELRALADVGVPMLMVCGLYQLFGRSFETADGTLLQGLGILDAETRSRSARLIGNVVTTTPFGEMVGFENHAGTTVLGGGQVALGQVLKGAGNNGIDKTEGAMYKHVFGTYLHGSVLPQNPRFADAILEAAALHRYGAFEAAAIDDRFADQARSAARARHR